MAKTISGRRPERNRQGTNWTVIGGFLAIGVIGLFALLFSTIQGQGQPTPTPSSNTVVSDYCQNNPENCVAKGSEEAPVTLVEVSDYGCGHCQNFNLTKAATLDEAYVAINQMRWVALPFSLSSTTKPAAEAAMCANEQDAFWDFHRIMFEIQTTPNALTKAGFVAAAEQLELNMDDFNSCVDSSRYSSVIDRNNAIATSAGVTGTPTFFINGKKVEGNVPLENFSQEIEQASQ